jgi:hypothetical protein
MITCLVYNKTTSERENLCIIMFVKNPEEEVEKKYE